MSKPTIEECIKQIEAVIENATYVEQFTKQPQPMPINTEILRILRAVKEQRDALGTARGKMFDVITAMVYAPQCDGCEGRGE